MSKYENTRPVTFQELEAIVEDMDSDDGVIDVAYIPPEVDGLTDDEQIDEDALRENNLFPSNLVGTFDIFTSDNDTDNDTNLPGTSSQMPKKTKNKSVIWCRKRVNYSTIPTSNEEVDLLRISEALDGKSPLDLFKLFFDENVMQMIVQYSLKYARDNNRPDFEMDVRTLEQFIGILLLSGYHRLPELRMYWSSDEDKGVQLVKETMPRNRFQIIKKNLHLSDNEQLVKQNKFSKLQPLFHALNQNFMQFGVFRQHLSIDKQTVPYFGRQKMFIKRKPVQFGFKIWCITSSDGYLFQFIPYGGKSDEIGNLQLGLSGEIVTKLLSVLQNRNAHKVYFDNFFTSYKLLVHLKSEGYLATGTVSENRLGSCPLECSKVMAKKPRGSYDARYDHENEISVIRWNDNSIVTLASNCETVEILSTVKRNSRKERKEAVIRQPNLISKYNRYMGGVDLHNNAIANYRIQMRGKKWWWPLFANCIDSAVVNAWKIHQIVYKDKPMSQIDFRSLLVRSLLKKEDAENCRQYGRAAPNPCSEVKFDNVGHLIKKNQENWRRRCRVCKSTTVFMCVKCKIPLHTNCFVAYHSK